ncbi:MAG: 5-formyltetrahydrofolate cyclo-ligase [Parerythrobacter sp.]
MLESKSQLRTKMRAVRDAAVAAQPAGLRALLFRHPPKAILDRIASDAVVSIYSATGNEAPSDAYAAFFAEARHRVARPFFADKGSVMEFAVSLDPIGNSDLEPGPWGALQPTRSSERVVPDVHFVPLLAFTADGGRLGQGGGHYDRWFGDNKRSQAFALAWDEQQVERLPLEPHDIAMDAIITPTRIYGPFT